MLTGYRGQAAPDIKVLEDVRLRFSRLVEEIPDVSELDLNPIFALRQGKAARSWMPEFDSVQAVTRHIGP